MSSKRELVPVRLRIIQEVEGILEGPTFRFEQLPRVCISCGDLALTSGSRIVSYFGHQFVVSFPYCPKCQVEVAKADQNQLSLLRSFGTAVVCLVGWYFVDPPWLKALLATVSCAAIVTGVFFWRRGPAGNAAGKIVNMERDWATIYACPVFRGIVNELPPPAPED